MIVRIGNLWEEVGRSDLVLFTANSVLDSRGHLVMGAGAALEAKRQFPMLPANLGLILEKHPTPKKYGVLVSNYYRFADPYSSTRRGTFLGAFQTKENWKDNSRLDLIEYAVEVVNILLPNYPRIAINFPGINHGRLREEDVLPLLQSLPDSVVFYKKG